jgi:hypothetical protein
LTVKQHHGTMPGGEMPAQGELPGCDAFEAGVVFGLLVGEGHFGGDGRQAQITLRMHVRHERLFRWLEGAFPEARLYGPYRHGGREYFQWMARGSFLRDVLVPFLRRRHALMDDYVGERFDEMCRRYSLSSSEPVKDG